MDQALDLDREMQEILLAANAVARGLEAGWVDDGEWESFRRWETVLHEFDRFEDMVAVALAVRPASPDRRPALAEAANKTPAVTGMTKDDVDAGGGSSNRLMLKARDLLVAMLELDAVSEAKQMTRAFVVERVNPHEDVQDYVRAFRQLKSRRYYDSAKGPEGGVWLTRAGLDEARRWKKSPA
jgi:hypothetical protein